MSNFKNQEERQAVLKEASKIARSFRKELYENKSLYREWEKSDDDIINAIGWSMELVGLILDYYEEGNSDPSFCYDLAAHSNEIYHLFRDLNY